MKNNYVTKLVFAIFAVCLWTAPSFACKSHNRLASRSTSLPGDSVYHLKSKWMDQDKNTVSFQSLSGRPRIVAMVYTKCPTSCPMLVQDVKTAFSQIPASLGKDLHVDFFSFDSENENPETLQQFRAKYHMDKNWSAYTGSQSAVSELAAVLGIQYKKLPSGDFIHQNVMFLLSDKGEILAKLEGFKNDNGEFRMKVEKALQAGG